MSGCPAVSELWDEDVKAIMCTARLPCEIGGCVPVLKGVGFNGGQVGQM